MVKRAVKCAYCNKVIREEPKLYTYYNVRVPLCDECAEHYFNNTCYKCNKSLASDFNPYPGRTKSRYLGLCTDCLSDKLGLKDASARINNDTTVITDWALEASRASQDANSLELLFGAGHSLKDIVLNIDNVFNVDNLDDVIRDTLIKNGIVCSEEQLEQYKKVVISYIDKIKKVIDLNQTKINQGSSQYGTSYLNQLYLFWLKRTLDLGKQMEIKDEIKYRENLDALRKEELDLISFKYAEQNNNEYIERIGVEDREILGLYGEFGDIEGTVKDTKDTVNGTVVKTERPEYCLIERHRSSTDKPNLYDNESLQLEENKAEISSQIDELSGLSMLGIVNNGTDNPNKVMHSEIAEARDIINILMDERLINKSGWSLLSLLDALDHNTYNKCLAAVIRYQGKLSNAKAAVDMVEVGSDFEQKALELGVKGATESTESTEPDQSTPIDLSNTDWDLLGQVGDLLGNIGEQGAATEPKSEPKPKAENTLDSKTVLDVYKQASSLIKQVIEDELIITPFPIVGSVEFKPDRLSDSRAADKKDKLLKDFGIKTKSTVGTYQIYEVKAIEKPEDKIILSNDKIILSNEEGEG